MEFLLPFFRWCDSTWLGETIRNSRIYFPVIETFHLLALTVLFGAVVVLNLRLCKVVMNKQPVQVLARDLAPWAFWSLVVILVSGIMLFLSEALKCYASKPFQVKMVFLFAALIFHYTVHRKITRVDRDPHLFSGLLVGGINFFLWLGVGLGGRAIGFL
jgi:uncharacterized membrane protein